MSMLPEAERTMSNREEDPKGEKVVVAKFDGSFAALGRPETKRPVPWYRDRQYFLGSWLDASIWRSAFVEFVGTTCLVYISGQIAGTLFSYGTNQVGAYIGISNIIIVSVFIYATAAGSGGHMNPMITFSVMLAGLCPLPRGVLYLCGQTLGAALGGGMLAGAWGYERTIMNQGGGCFLDPAFLSPGQAFLNEMFMSFALLFLAFGVGLDPRQALFFGPRFGPLLVGMAVGAGTFASSGMAPGYSGAQMHPARCFGFGVAKRDMTYQWIWWFGPAAASVLMGIMYNLIPPHREERDRGESKTTTEGA